MLVLDGFRQGNGARCKVDCPKGQLSKLLTDPISGSPASSAGTGLIAESTDRQGASEALDGLYFACLSDLTDYITELRITRSLKEITSKPSYSEPLWRRFAQQGKYHEVIIQPLRTLRLGRALGSLAAAPAPHLL